MELKIDKEPNNKINLEKEILQNQLAKIYKAEIDKQPVLDLKKFKKDNTVLVIIDMIEGFTRIGNLKSDRIKEKIKTSLLQTHLQVIVFLNENII